MGFAAAAGAIGPDDNIMLPRVAGKQHLKGRLFPPLRGSVIGRSALEKKLMHVADVLADPDFTDFEGQRVGGQRTVLAVPLVRQDRVIGIISMLKYLAVF